MKIFLPQFFIILLQDGSGIKMFFDGEGNGNPLLYSCLEKSTDRGVWWAAVHGIT